MSTTKWILDPSHSELTFKVKHLMITNVRGEFKKFEAEIDGDDLTNARVNAIIDAGSIYTNDENRDNHLKSGDFFDVEKYKKITFESKSTKKTGDSTFKMNGVLSIKNIPNEVTLNVEFGGINRDPWGNEKAGFSFSGKISRKEWGLNWNAALETGGVLVGDEITISGEVQFVKQANEKHDSEAA